ncbi:MAG: ribosome biogenesis GTPase Der [Gammaproteobacteria bacterium]|nr:ribosome biogenesis GTPase Der [Gammaproteobacteria bacterium]
MIPTIVFVGRPNVGKSTLFNRLTRTQDALVADFPGLTRDRKYGTASFEGKPFLVVDTGGIGVEDLAVDALMASQSERALEEASHVFFLVDAQTGLTSTDEKVALHLRKHGKNIHLLINKTDGLDEAVVCAEFQMLGFSDIHPISATHGRGIQQLLQQVTADFPQAPPEENLTAEGAIRVAIIGRPNVGKSTLVNRMLGEERMVVFDMPGTTRDSVEVPFEREGQDYILVDTAGIRRRSRVDEKIEKFSIIKTLGSIQAANVCVMLIDSHEDLTDQDLHLIGFIINAGRALVIAANKWDGLDSDHRDHIKEAILRKLQFAEFAKFHFISALHGSGVGRLFKDINEAYRSAVKSLSTPELTRILQDLVAKHPPPLVQGRRIKLRYAHAGGHNPPLVVIHGNQVEALPASYKRYLTKEYITRLKLVGTPLKILFKGGENPYEGKKNKLTNTQVKHRKRMMNWVKKKKR